MFKVGDKAILNDDYYTNKIVTVVRVLSKTDYPGFDYYVKASDLDEQYPVDEKELRKLSKLEQALK